MALSFTLACLLAVAALVASELASWTAGRRVFKIAASTAFVFVALALQASSTRYGQLIVLALVLGAVGDVCLLSRRSAAFLAGLGFFLSAHLVYAAAFADGPLNPSALWAGLGGVGVVGGLTLRWLWPHLRGAYKGAVCVYVVAIVAMCALALARSAMPSAPPWVAVGALAFAASDIAVARERFVHPGIFNKLWGLPVYYVAQLLIAWSV